MKIGSEIWHLLAFEECGQMSDGFSGGIAAADLIGAGVDERFVVLEHCWMTGQHLAKESRPRTPRSDDQ